MDTYPVTATIERDCQDTSGHTTGDAWLARALDPQGPLHGLFAWGASVDEAASALAAQVWQQCRSASLTDDVGDLVEPHQIKEIVIATIRSTQHPVTSQSQPDRLFGITYELIRHDSTWYAVVDEAFRAIDEHAHYPVMISGSSEAAATSALLRWVRLRILSGDLTRYGIDRTWPGTVVLNRLTRHSFATSDLDPHGADVALQK